MFKLNSPEAGQRRGARYVKNKFSGEDSITKMIKALGWEPLHSRRVKMRILLLFKIIYDFIDVATKQLHPSSTRIRGHSMRFSQISAKQNHYKHSFLPQTIEHWNTLPSELMKLKDLDTVKADLSKLTLNFWLLVCAYVCASLWVRSCVFVLNLSCAN